MSGTETPKHSNRAGEGGGILEMPENHLDIVVSPGSVDPSRKASLRTTLIAVVSMPVFFLLAFTLCYVSATHAPVPHDLALTLAGPASVTEQVADTIADTAEGAFDVTQTTSTADARQAVEQRDAVGAVVVRGDDVTAVIASGGGRLATTVVQQVAQRVAAELGGTATVDEVAPLPSDDPGGSVLFFLLVICTVGAFLSITAVSQTIRNVGLKPMIATAFAAAVIVPVLGFAMISVYVDFEVPFGTVAAVIGIGMLYTLTVGLLSALLTKVVGQAAIFAVILVLIAFNFPSAGGSVPESLLPPFWQVVHNSWLGPGAFEAMRSILFFDGNQTGRWLLQLLIWLGVTVVLQLLLLVGMRGRRAAVQAPESSSSEQHVDSDESRDGAEDEAGRAVEPAGVA